MAAAAAWQLLQCKVSENMAHIIPFRALRYNPECVDLARVVTQPYDKISPQMQARYYDSSPYNLVRIILGLAQPGDGEHNNVYTRAAEAFRSWRKDGVLKPDPEPAIYIYAQQFTDPRSNQTMERKGFIAAGKIEDYSAGIVHRHEQTLAKPKADRLNLLRATRAHFGQLFMLYDDAREMDSLLEPRTAPDIDVNDEYSVSHRVWKVADPALIQTVQNQMRDKKLIIADGHHRYETAMAYRTERHAENSSTASQPAPYDFAMMTFVNLKSAGLLILPTHRVVHGLGSLSPDDFKTKAKAYFDVEEVDPSIDSARATGVLREAGRAGTALLAVMPSRTFLIHKPRASGEIFAGLSVRQQLLDVVQLHRCLLESALGLSQESIRNQLNLSYVRGADEALDRVRSGAANVAFVMNPVRINQVRDIAFGGEVLPQKSTDFYPKLLSGLTVYALD
jgi:uncharacterized protein (DUF1015 family)